MTTTFLAHSVARRRPSPAWMLAAPLGAMAYPFLLKAFHGAVTATTGSNEPLAALTLILALVAPLTGFAVGVRLGEVASPDPSQVAAKRIALLSTAAAPIFTATGVLLGMAHAPVTDISVWLVLWAVALALMARALWAKDSPPASVASASAPARVSTRLRVAHAVGALAIIVLFLAMHLSNHLVGLMSVAAHRHLMSIFRLIYRARLIEPIVVALFFVQVVSGLIMLAGYTRQKADIFRTLQIATGAYLVFFILGHMNSVFLYARLLSNIKTDWDFAVGAPTGLIKDSWNIRLLPHYLLGVFSVLAHISLGARVVAIGHGVDVAKANRLTTGAIFVSAVVAIAIILGMSGVHLAQ